MSAFRTDERVIPKGRKDCSTPMVKTAENRTFFFWDSREEAFINRTVPGIQAAIPDHFKVFFRDMADQLFDEINSRDCFFNVLIIFMTVVMESNRMTVIVVDPGGSDHRPSKITSDVVDDSFRIAFIRLCINIKPMFVFCVAKRLNAFEGRTEFVFQSIEKGGAEGIS